jgi:hypothetical protein
MSVSIYNRGGGASSDALKGVHSLVYIEPSRVTSQSTESSALTTLTMITNGVITAPFIPNQSFYANFAIIIVATAGVASQTARIMVYNDANGLPDTLLYGVEGILLDSTGVKNIKINFSFIAGTIYWLAIQTDSNTAVLNAIPVASLLCLQNVSSGSSASTYGGTGLYSNGAQDPFSNYTSLSYFGTSMPFIGLRKA